MYGTHVPQFVPQPKRSDASSTDLISASWSSAKVVSKQTQRRIGVGSVINDSSYE